MDSKVPGAQKKQSQNMGLQGYIQCNQAVRWDLDGSVRMITEVYLHTFHFQAAN
jgi:hypothetical protein